MVEKKQKNNPVPQATKTKKEIKNTRNDTNKNYGSSGGVIYGLGFIGAAVYYISTATSFWMGVWGFVKAILWPAFLVHGLLQFLGL